MRRVSIVAVVAALAPAGAALAQGLGPDEARLSALTALERSRGPVAVRWDAATGAPASLRFDAETTTIRAESPELAAVALAREVADLFERSIAIVESEELAPASGSALVVRPAADLGSGRARIDLDQVCARVPVAGARLSIELARVETGFAPVAIVGRFFPELRLESATASREVEAALAERFPAVRHGKLEARAERRLVVAARGRQARLAFEVRAPLGEPPVTWRILIDATSGEELGRTQLACEAQARGLVYEKNPQETPRASQPLPGLYVYQGQQRATTDAAGNHKLTGTVTLEQAMSGPLLRVFVDGQPELTYSGPADIDLQPDEALAAQDEVSAFYHVTNYNAYMATTYGPSVTKATDRFGVIVRFKRGGQPFANAFFSPGAISLANETFPGYIALGTFGGHEAAKSSSVVRHEYTHALLNGIVSLYGTLESAGMNEGLADYFPCVQQEDPRLGIWVINPAIRDLTKKYVWPQDNNGDPHRVGNIFAGALWQARTQAEAAKAGDAKKVDQAVWQGVLRFQPDPTLVEGRDAIVAADKAVNGGAFGYLLEKAFFDHGIGPAPVKVNHAPVLAPISDGAVEVGATLTLDIPASDPDKDPLTWSASALANGTIDAKTGRFTFTPDATQSGVQRVTFTVTDGMLSANETIAIRVLEAPTTTASTATVGSLATPASTASAPPTLGTTGAAAPVSHGGGGGGCAIGGAGEATPFALIPYLFVIAALRRKRRAA